MGDAGRWVEVAVQRTPTTIALAPPPEGRDAGGSQTGIILDTTDVDADHAALKAAGVDVDDEITCWGGPVSRKGLGQQFARRQRDFPIRYGLARFS